MDKLAESIANNPYIVLLVEAATIIALILAIVIPIIQKRKKCLTYSYVTNVLINEKISEVDELSISFKGKEVNHLSVTCFDIINSGNVTIDSSEVYHGHELKIITNEPHPQVISAKLISQSSDTIDGIVNYDDSCVNVSFQTLEADDYLSLNIYHTGDEKTGFILEGKIKETKLILSLRDNKPDSIFTKIIGVILGILIGLATLLCIITITYEFDSRAILTAIMSGITLLAIVHFQKTVQSGKK